MPIVTKFFLADGGNEKPSFDVDKIVFLGASITDQSISTQSTRSFIESYVNSVYGKDITVVERATAGWVVSDLKNNIDSILAEFSGEVNTHFFMHILGNDVAVGTQFNDLSESKKAQLKEDLEYIYDSVQSAGHKLIQASVTYRNYNHSSDGLSILDPDPSLPKDRELEGSYTYTRDLIVPVMEEKAPEFLNDGWPIIDLYNATRNVYSDWNDGTDVVHPNKWARIIYTMECVEKFIQLSIGSSASTVTPFNFDSTPTVESITPIVYGLGATQVTDTATGNINWFGRSKYAEVKEANINFENSINALGDSTGVAMRAFINSAWDSVGGNVSDPSNDSVSLENNTLLSSYVGILASAGAVFYAVIEGLQPFSKYQVQTVSVRLLGDGTGDHGVQVHLHKGVPVDKNSESTNPENEIVTDIRMTDYRGRLFIAIAENSGSNRPVINGIKIG